MMKRCAPWNGYRGMAHEIEVKLEAPGTAARRLLAAPWFKRLEAAPVKHEHLVSVYYDTAAAALRGEGLSLRVRRIGQKRIQTVKEGPRGVCGPFCEHEWEHEISGNQPELSGGEETALDQFSRKRLKRELRPVFTTDVTRGRSRCVVTAARSRSQSIAARSAQRVSGHRSAKSSSS